jgi:hypothetical protein
LVYLAVWLTTVISFGFPWWCRDSRTDANHKKIVNAAS